MAKIALRTLILVLSATLSASASFSIAISASADDRLTVLAELPIAGTPGDLEARRLGRDATLSLVTVTRTDVQTWPAGTVSEPRISPGGGRSPAFGDFDGDGLLDLAVLRDGPNYNARPPILVVLRGDGTGLFEERLTIPLDGYRFSLATADVNGDGKADLVLETALFDLGSPTLSTYRSLGAFRFDEPRRTNLGPPFYSTGLITAGDLDGDGLADVVVSKPDTNGSVSVWRNVGDGTFVASTLGLRAHAPGRAILADLDRDGRPDLVYRTSEPIAPFWIEIFHNEGGGRFTSSGRKEISFLSGSVVVADEDGDGLLDLVVRQGIAGADSRISIFRGDGHGAFGPEQRRLLPPYAPLVPYEPLFSTSSLVALDWDSDGKLDFALMSELGPIVLGAESSRHDVLLVPVLLSTTGAYGTRFDSDLLLTNTGATTVRVELHYVAFLGGGSGVVTREIGPGEQILAPSALDFLREAGLPIARDGPAVGTLRVEAFGGQLPTSLSATVRTTSPGGAGVSWTGVPSLDTLRGDSFVPWLVESDRDRTNLALVNAGKAEDGPITLRVTVESGDPAMPGHTVLPDVVLAPGGFFQFPRALDAAGLASRLGWARISRVAGTARYLAWGAVNDAGSGDGAFVPAVSATGPGRLTRVVPSVIQSGRYTTEIVVTNPEEVSVTISILFPATETHLEETLAPHQVFYLPDLFAEFRRRGLRGAPGAGVSIAGPLYVSSSVKKVLAGARVSTAASAGRFYGLFEPAVAVGSALGDALIVPDLRQDERLRTNLGLVNLSDSNKSFRIEIHDGETGRLVTTHLTKVLGRDEFLQLSSVLRDLAPSVRRGWARVVPAIPSSYFLAYGVVMDGAEPGLGTDDGTFVLGHPE